MLLNHLIVITTAKWIGSTKLEYIDPNKVKPTAAAIPAKKFKLKALLVYFRVAITDGPLKTVTSTCCVWHH